MRLFRSSYPTFAWVGLLLAALICGPVVGQTNDIKSSNANQESGEDFEALPIPPRILPKLHDKNENPFATQFDSAYRQLNLSAAKPPTSTAPVRTAKLEPNVGGSNSFEPTAVADLPARKLPAPLPFELNLLLPNQAEGETEQADPNKLEVPDGKKSTVQNLEKSVEGSFGDPRSAAIPSKLLWWKDKIHSPTRPEGSQESVETNSLVYLALKRSPRLRAISQTPLIREQQITEAESEFDPVSFVRSQFQDRVDPVGDSLSITNDGTDFLDDHIWTADMGLRRKSQSGAQVELSQRLGFRNSNSAFFSPQDQGTATLALNVTQPLMRGRGQYYNRSQILIAQAAGGAAWDTLAVELQNEVQSVVESYWRLYYDRSVFMQKQMNVQRAESILAKLEGRSTLDSLPSQIARARSAVLSRKTELANAMRDIRNSETEIRRLIAETNWAQAQMIEMIPIEFPEIGTPVTQLDQVIVTAMNNRAEVRETLKRSKIAAIQRDISINELMPELSLLMGTYVSALQGESRLGDAYVDQFSNRPGYSVGLEFELPIRNRSARTRLTQRKLQLNAIKAEVDEAMQNVIAESQISFRRVLSAKETLAAATEAILAARMDLEQNQGRWESFALIEGDIAEGQTPTTVLDQLLDSQERLAAAELVYAQAEMELKTSETALQRTMGTLLTHRSVSADRSCTNCLPAIDFNQTSR